MDTQVIRASVCGYANPSTVKQAPNHKALGFTTQTPLESETKYYPYAKPYPRFRPSNVLKPLPEFPFGVNPTYNRQEDTQGHLRQNISLPDVFTTGRVLDADMVETYAKIEAQSRSAPSALSADYQGSPWMYGALYGLPLSHPTNSSNFITEYGEALSDKEWHRRTERLVEEGYEPEKIHRAMEAHIGDYLKKRIGAR